MYSTHQDNGQYNRLKAFTLEDSYEHPNSLLTHSLSIFSMS